MMPNGRRKRTVWKPSTPPASPPPDPLQYSQSNRPHVHHQRLRRQRPYLPGSDGSIRPCPADRRGPPPAGPGRNLHPLSGPIDGLAHQRPRLTPPTPYNTFSSNETNDPLRRDLPLRSLGEHHHRCRPRMGPVPGPL